MDRPQSPDNLRFASVVPDHAMAPHTTDGPAIRSRQYDTADDGSSEAAETPEFRRPRQVAQAAGNTAVGDQVRSNTTRPKDGPRNHDADPSPDRPPSPEAPGSDDRPIDAIIADEERSTLQGAPQGMRFLARQVLNRQASKAVREADVLQRKMAEGADDAPRHVQKQTFMNFNFAPRPPEPKDKEYFHPDKVCVVQGDAFGPDGAVDSLPPSHRKAALAAATSGGDKTVAAAHRGILDTVEEILTVTTTSSDDMKVNEDQANLEELTEAANVLDKARLGKKYVESPRWLGEDQVNALIDANTAQLEPLRQQVSSLRVGLKEIYTSSNEAANKREAEEAAAGQQAQTAGTSRELVPLGQTQAQSDEPLVAISRLSVNPNSYDAILEMEVRALGMVALAVVSNGDGYSVPVLQFEGAEKLADLDPKTFADIQRKCANAQPPIRLLTTFNDTNEQTAPFMRGGRTVVGPFDKVSPSEIAKSLPAQPMIDDSSETHNVGSNDGINQGENANLGFNPEQAQPNSGTSASGGSSLGTNASYSETKQKTVRPPHTHELTKGVPGWHAAHYDEITGEVTGVHDLHNRGAKVRDTLLPETSEPTMDVRPMIAATDSRLRELRGEHSPQNRDTVGGLPSLPRQPEAPGGSKQAAIVQDVHQSMQMTALSQNAGLHGRVTPNLLTGDAIDEFRRQVTSGASNTEDMQVNDAESFVRWCRTRSNAMSPVSARAARAAWRQRYGNPA